MKDSLRKKILLDYPEWHNYPLRLTIPEIKKPAKVIKSFFESYSLPSIRACLREWLEDSLTDPESLVREHLYTYNDVERLVEAVFVLHKDRIKKKKK